MTNQPFNEQAVVLRLPKDEYSFERVFVRSKDAMFGARIYSYVGRRWCQCQPTMHDAADLLRQLDTKNKRIESLESLCIEAANELTKTLPANHSLRVRLEAAGDGKEIPNA